MKIRAADLFAGAGGGSTGLLRAAAALGLEVDLLAINHWPTAVETHLRNHPHVRHLCESIERVDPREQVPGGRLNLLIAGPECTHFSTARGGRPVNPQSRATAWSILKWAQELYIDAILIENVPEFRSWGPIGADHKPLKSKKGETYRAFLAALRSLGYTVDDRILNAADYGDPTTRQRLFILARRGRGKSVTWPAPTHSRTGGGNLFGSTKRWRPARDVIDWSIAGKSIFSRKKPLRPATIARILAGLDKFGGPELRPFLVILRNHMAGQSIDAPLPTVAAQGQHIALCEPFILQQQSGGAPRAVTAPLPTITTDGAISVVQPYLVQTSERRAERVDSVDDPIRTITAMGGRCFGLAEPFLVPYNGTAEEARVHSVDEPLRTQTTENRFGVAQPFLVPMYGEREGQGPRTHSVDEPVPTIPATGGGKFGVVEPYIVSAGGAKLRSARGTSEPMPTVMGSDRLAIVEPFLTKYNRTATSAYSVDEPLDTVSTRDRFALVQPVVNGYVLDIHFRMLQPHELAAAMSFPKTYVFQGTREETVKQIGNAWPGELATALCTTALQPYSGRRGKDWREEATA